MQQTSAALSESDAELAALRERVHELEQALIARDRFISVAAHELRNPIAPLVLQAQLLERLARQEGCLRLAEGLVRLDQLIDRCVDRANVMLEVSRIAGDRLKLEPVECDLSELLDDTVQAFAPAAARAGCALVVARLDAARGRWDSAAVRQIFENLLSNAIKFGAGKPVEVALSVSPECVAIRVSDRGPGIAPEAVGRIFAPFSVLMARVSSGGFGVGLWVANQLATRMGGKIEVANHPGYATSFLVTLPPTLSRNGHVEYNWSR
jgi:signal transduction histidine kinase